MACFPDFHVLRSRTIARDLECIAWQDSSQKPVALYSTLCHFTVVCLQLIIIIRFLLFFMHNWPYGFGKFPEWGPFGTLICAYREVAQKFVLQYHCYVSTVYDFIEYSVSEIFSCILKCKSFQVLKIRWKNCSKRTWFVFLLDDIWNGFQAKNIGHLRESCYSPQGNLLELNKKVLKDVLYFVVGSFCTVKPWSNKETIFLKRMVG